MIPTKSSPAAPCVTTCSAGAPEPIGGGIIYKHPAARISSLEGDKPLDKMPQTTDSGNGTSLKICQESFPSSRGSTISYIAEEIDTGIDGRDRNAPPSFPSLMVEKVKTRLTALSWDKDMTEEEVPRWLPLIEPRQHQLERSTASEDPLAPPNTARESAQSSGQISNSRSPALEPEDYVEDGEDDEEPMIELRTRSARARPHSVHPLPHCDDLLNIPTRRHSLPHTETIQRNPSNLDDPHFRGHRDSVDFTRQRLSHHQRINQHLQNAQDSFLLTKTRLDGRHPGFVPSLTPTNTWNRCGGLSTIVDGSPPTPSACFVDADVLECNCACPVHCKRRRG